MLRLDFEANTRQPGRQNTTNLAGHFLTDCGSGNCLIPVPI
jgi:hypothetical protein